MILSFSNQCSSDYICSDIHGHFSLLAQQLKQINFNEQTDRLFSLGDLMTEGMSPINRSNGWSSPGSSPFKATISEC